MKVLLVNGSPNKNGCTFTALSKVQKTLVAEGIGADIFWIGKKPVGGCIVCGTCSKNKKCAFDDKVNEFTALAKEYDGFVIGSPVYYAGMNGSLKGFLDRAFFSGSRMDENPFTMKPAAAVCSARRAGTTATFDEINKYFLISQMPVVPSRYWNMVHGSSPEQVMQDAEGLQIMRILGRNMAWMLKSFEAGKAAGVSTPEKEETVFTNFIR